MARTGARLMQLIDAVLIAVVVEKVDPASVFGAGGVKGWCERNEISTDEAQRTSAVVLGEIHHP